MVSTKVISPISKENYEISKNYTIAIKTIISNI